MFLSKAKHIFIELMWHLSVVFKKRLHNDYRLILHFKKHIEMGCFEGVFDNLFLKFSIFNTALILL